MNRCKDCKHWNRADPYKWHGTTDLPHHRCMMAPTPGELPRQEADWYELDVEAAGRLPFADDLSGCGSLMTPPDFGCVLWEKKE